jgi:hypothetical protein
MATIKTFDKMPYEIRHKIWENLIPAKSSTNFHTGALADHILDLPHDDAFWRPQLRRKGGYCNEGDGSKWILETLYEESPYRPLSGCLESRIIALKHVKKLLEDETLLKKWLEKPSFPYHPKLALDKTAGTLIYSCPGITEEHHLEQLVFWELPEEGLASDEDGDDWDPDYDHIDAILEDLEWSDDEVEVEEQVAGAGVKRGREREDEDTEGNLIDPRSPKRQNLGRETVEDKA